MGRLEFRKVDGISVGSMEGRVMKPVYCINRNYSVFVSWEFTRGWSLYIESHDVPSCSFLLRDQLAALRTPTRLHHKSDAGASSHMPLLPTRSNFQQSPVYLYPLCSPHELTMSITAGMCLLLPVR